MARHAPAELQTKFLAAVKRGQITSGSQAALKFGVSQTSIWKWVSDARKAGYTFATSGGDAWAIIKEGKPANAKR